jgi:kynureninase
LEEGCRIAASVDMAQVRAKSRALGDLFLRLVEERCGPGLFGVACPRDSARRGSQVSLTHPDGHAVIQALIAEGVIGDFRAPDVLRFGFAPLYVRFADIDTATAKLAEIMRTGTYRQERFKVRAAVT